MNDESPIRTSSMLLTVACVVCGISAAVLMLPRYFERPRSVNHSTAAGELQLNLAEFHANQPKAAPEQDQLLPPTRRKLVPVSSAIPLKKSPGSGVASTMQSETQLFGGVRSVQPASSNFIESTVVNRHVQPSASPVGSGPLFYAPVTVHPVTVNIDNSGIIREITRVNERLDSLAAEKSRFEKDVMARIEEGNSASPKTAASATAVEVHSPAPRHNVGLQDKVHSIADTTSTTSSTKVSKNAQARMAFKDVPPPVEKSRKDAPQRTVERLKIATPPVVYTRDVLPAARLEPVAVRASVPEPVVAPSVKFHQDEPVRPMPEVEFDAEPKPPEALTREAQPAARFEPVAVRASVPEPVVVPPVKFHQKEAIRPTSEIEFEAKPETPVPDVPSFELPSEESETIESQSVPEFEFTTELLPVPSSVPVTPEVASFIDFEAEPVAAAEPVAKSEFDMAAANVTSDVKSATPQTSEIPVLPDLTAPGLQWSKRTTDPPFRSGVIASRSTPRGAIPNRAASKIQQVSHTVEAVKQPEPPAIPVCHECGKPKVKSDYRVKAVAPPSPIQRLRSLFR